MAMSDDDFLKSVGRRSPWIGLYLDRHLLGRRAVRELIGRATLRFAEFKTYLCISLDDSRSIRDIQQFCESGDGIEDD